MKDPQCPACRGDQMMGRAVVHVAKGAPNKIDRAMGEYKSGALHSGSKTGPPVTNRKQAIAIALSEQKKANKGGY